MNAPFRPGVPRRLARFGVVVAAVSMTLTLAGVASAAPARPAPARPAPVAPAAGAVVAGVPAASTPTLWWIAPRGRAATACPTVYWGSLAKTANRSTSATIGDVRAGRHACFDRVVIDLGSGNRTTGYAVRYASSVREEGSGRAIALRGGAKLEVVVNAATFDALTGRVTYQPTGRKDLVDVRHYSTLRQVAFGGSFEGQTTFGIGVRARLPFRVFTLDGPGSGHRLVIDIAHHW